MKVTKWVESSQEVEIEIGADDVISALYETNPEGYAPKQQVVRAVNALADVFRKMPSEGIAELTPHARALIRTFLQEQSERFKEPA